MPIDTGTQKIRLSALFGSLLILIMKLLKCAFESSDFFSDRAHFGDWSRSTVCMLKNSMIDDRICIRCTKYARACVRSCKLNDSQRLFNLYLCVTYWYVCEITFHHFSRFELWIISVCCVRAYKRSGMHWFINASTWDWYLSRGICSFLMRSKFRLRFRLCWKLKWSFFVRIESILLLQFIGYVRAAINHK